MSRGKTQSDLRFKRSLWLVDSKQREAGIREGGGEGAISIIQPRSKHGLDQVGAEVVLRSKAPPARISPTRYIVGQKQHEGKGGTEHNPTCSLGNRNYGVPFHRAADRPEQSKPGEAIRDSFGRITIKSRMCYVHCLLDTQRRH